MIYYLIVLQKTHLLNSNEEHSMRAASDPRVRIISLDCSDETVLKLVGELLNPSRDADEELLLIIEQPWASQLVKFPVFRKGMGNTDQTRFLGILHTELEINDDKLARNVQKGINEFVTGVWCHAYKFPAQNFADKKVNFITLAIDAHEGKVCPTKKLIEVVCYKALDTIEREGAKIK